MKTKLTLRIDKTAIDQARKYAGSHQTSPSSLVETYLEQLTKVEGKDGKAPPLFEEITGILSLKPDSKPRKSRNSPHRKLKN